MHIVMFSINPLFPTHVLGGAPKHLQQIALHMGRKGHDVTVICTRPDANATEFFWHSRVRVLPVLPFKQPFPQPYAVPAYDLATVIQTVGELITNADRFYMHDGEFLFPYAFRDVPTVISLRDNVYPETLLGGFLFEAHRLILISEYSRQFILHTVGRFFPELAERTRVIHNGIDWEQFRQNETGEIEAFLGLRRDGRPILLHPHRPEPAKGIFETIAVADLLVNQHGFDNLLVLAPKWHNTQTSSELSEFYGSIEREIADRRLVNNFMFHDWIPQEFMPQYYSLGQVTVALGSFVESFGNAVYESLGCGTPAIAARISTHRELLPDSMLNKVDYSDVETAARIAARIIRNGERTPDSTLTYLRDRYSIERQMAEYEAEIVGAELAQPMRYHLRKITSETRFSLAPWCYVSQKQGIYHDFRAGFARLDQLVSLLGQYSHGFTETDARKVNIGSEELHRLLLHGFIVPVV